MDTLAKQNPHPRDQHIKFDEPTHVYTIDGDSNYMSVTTWNHSHFKHFDADKILNINPFLKHLITERIVIIMNIKSKEEICLIKVKKKSIYFLRKRFNLN